MANQKPIELYFTSPIYARGEHIVGVNAVDDRGKPIMFRIERGERKVIVASDARGATPAADLIIAKQAIDWKNASATDREEAEAFVKERNKIEAAESAKLKKAA